jgi:hypothetical protein
MVRVLVSLVDSGSKSVGMPGRGFEPPPSFEDHHLKVARLPIPPPGLWVLGVCPERVVSVAKIGRGSSLRRPVIWGVPGDLFMTSDRRGGSRAKSWI